MDAPLRGGREMTQMSDTNIALDKETVLRTVTEMVEEVLGEDMLLDEITMGTLFSEDLELESIEFVALSERLQERYGDQVDFVSWLSEMELPEIIGLSVGQLVDHIASCLS
jgi:acyl carrier protein